MKLRWLKNALKSLRSAHQFITAENSEAASKVVMRIERSAERLREYPHSGRTGTVTGTREVVVPGLPYLIVYRVTENEVQILRVFHTSRQPH
jgi:addiction module RelE/StbE family toxin